MTTSSQWFAPDRLETFWRFICERQWVWHRRVVQGLPPPWTDDPILQRERFTNVYRELDPGTLYAIECILEVDAPRPDKLFNVMLYRLIGRSDTHAAVGFQFLDSFEPAALERSLKVLRDTGRSPFTAAYMVSAYSSMGSPDKISNVSRLFGLLRDDFNDFFDRIDRCKTAAEVHRTLSSAYGFGNFLAYQVLVDTLYPLRIYGNKGLLPFSHDDWSSPGPGACRGIKLLLNSNTTTSFLEAMRWLRAHQRSEFTRLGLDFPFLTDGEGYQIEISLANIQNCLCEFHKYVKICNGTGRGRRKFSRVAKMARESQVPMPVAGDERCSG